MRKRINRIIGLSCITVLCMCIFASCVKKPSPNEESSAAEEKSTQSGDNKASDIPTLSEVTSYSDDQMINLSKELDEDTLIKVWGEPFKTQYQRIWKIEQDGKTKYVEAFVMDGKVESLNNSVAMYAVVAKKHGGEIYCFLDWNDYIIDSGKLCHLPGSDVYGNSIDCEIGDRLLLQSNGIIIETYPGDIANPYEAIPQGKVSDEDMKRIESSMSSTGVFVEENVPANDEESADDALREESRVLQDTKSNREDNTYSPGEAGGYLVGEALSARYKHLARRFRDPRGHAFAAEEANNFIDRLKGMDAEVVGYDLVKNGPDRKIVNRDDSVTWIQDKYYKQCRSAANDLGLSISSRCKLVVPKADSKPPENKFNRFAG